ncbi:hypothetical protein J6590_088416 [Homalodisca vitripennis]|nr:hypothetical protein J6590_088416 [Homalodisca vitripennis]
MFARKYRRRKVLPSCNKSTKIRRQIIATGTGDLDKRDRGAHLCSGNSDFKCLRVACALWEQSMGTSISNCIYCAEYGCERFDPYIILMDNSGGADE